MAGDGEVKLLKGAKIYTKKLIGDGSSNAEEAIIRRQGLRGKSMEKMSSNSKGLHKIWRWSSLNTYLRDTDVIPVLFLYEIKDICGCYFPFGFPAAGHSRYLGFHRTAAKVLSGDNGRHNLIALSVGALPGWSSRWTFDMIGGVEVRGWVMEAVHEAMRPLLFQEGD